MSCAPIIDRALGMLDRKGREESLRGCESRAWRRARAWTSLRKDIAGRATVNDARTCG
jgi:hypothetical protein